jgi:hypothetical protein
MEEQLSWIIDPCKHGAAQLEHLQVPTEQARCGGLRESRVAHHTVLYDLSSACQGRKELFAQDGNSALRVGDARTILFTSLETGTVFDS